jgi:hypothetical protein
MGELAARVTIRQSRRLLEQNHVAYIGTDNDVHELFRGP